MKIYFIGDNKEVILTNRNPFTDIGDLLFPLNTYRRKAAIDPYNKNNLINWDNYNWNRSRMRAQPLGSIILDLLGTDFEKYDEFKNIVYLYGVDCLKINSPKIISSIIMEDEEGKSKQFTKESEDKIIRELYSHNVKHLIEAQYKFRKAVEECLMGDDSTFALGDSNATPMQRYVFYSLHANIVGNINHDGKKDNGMYNNQSTFDDETRLITYEKGSIEKYANNITEECFLLSDYYYEGAKQQISNINLSDIQVEEVNGYSVFDIATACYLEFKKMLLSNVFYRICRNCDQYFLVSENKRSLYCERVIDGQKDPCNVIGPRKTYYENLKERPIESSYRNAYKTRYARIRSAKDKRKAKADFMEWADLAKQKKAAALNGNITQQEFIDWLKAKGE